MKGAIRSKIGMLSLLGLISSACTAVINPALSTAPTPVPSNSQPNPLARVVAQQSFDICPVKVVADQRIVSDQKTWAALLEKSGSSPYTTWKPDFTKERVVMLSMGEKRSGGFSTSIAGSNLERDVLTIKFAQKVPAAGSFNTAQITSPCVVGLIDSRDAKTIQFIDLVTGGAL